jgi:hypothetical protein
MPLLPLSRYDIALGKVENPLDDPLFPLTVKKIKFIFGAFSFHSLPRPFSGTTTNQLTTTD